MLRTLLTNNIMMTHILDCKSPSYYIKVKKSIEILSHSLYNFVRISNVILLEKPYYINYLLPCIKLYSMQNRRLLTMILISIYWK